MEGTKGLIAKIRSQVDSHAIDAEQELIGYDRKKSGIISAISLHRWISSIGLNFTNQQIQMLVMSYQKGEGIDWQRLVQDIDNSKSYDLEAQSTPPKCVEELQILGGNLRVRRQTVRELLRPYDFANRGKVSVDDFYRAFGTSQVIRTIAKHYADTVTGSIDYFKLTRDIETVGAPAANQDAPVKDVPECFEPLARYIKNRSIDLDINFQRVDSLNNGKLTSRIFEGVISQLGANIRPSDLRDISSCFMDQETGLVNYKKFINTVADFKPRPTQAVLEATMRSQALPPKVNVDELLSEIAAIIRRRRIDLDYFFGGLPREGYTEGRIPTRRFAQILSQMELSIDSDEIKGIITRFYEDDPEGNCVNYVKFIDAVRPHIHTQEIKSTDVLTKLKQYLQQHRLTLAASAARYDREGSGNISPDQLASSLRFVGFDFAPQEFAALRDAFPGSERGTVSWRAIAAQVDSEIKPYRQMEEEQAPSKPQPKERPAPPPVVVEILSKISAGAASRNIDAYSELRAEDRFRRGYVNQQAFASFLSQLPVQLNQSDIRQVVSFYRVNGSSDVAYLAFCEDLSKAEQVREETMRTTLITTGTTERPLPEFNGTVHNFLMRFKSFASMHRLSAFDIFEPYDTNRLGAIPIFKVGAAFNNVQFVAMRAELEEVCAAFRDAKRRELFDYRMFDRALSEEDINTMDARTTLTGNPISAEVETEALIACSQIREKLLARNRRIEVAFRGVTEDTLPLKEFQERIASLAVVLRAGQINALYRKYRVGLTDDIRWREFVADVESSKTVGA